MPTVSIDYFFMGPSGQEEAQGVLPMLAVKSHESRMTFAYVVGTERTCGFHDPTTCCRSRLVGIAEIGVQIRSGGQRSSLSSKLFANRCLQLNS